MGGKWWLWYLLIFFFAAPAFSQDTIYLDKNLRWVQVMVDMLHPQRAPLFGWAILFPLLAFLFRAIAERKKKLFVMAGVAAGALPMIHTHSFLALGMICAVWLLLDLTDNSHFVTG